MNGMKGYASAHVAVPEIARSTDFENLLSAPVAIIEAPEGISPATLARLRTPDLTTAMFVPSPKITGKSSTAIDILGSLGKRNDVKGQPRNSTSTAEYVPLWLTAHRTRRLIAAPAQRVAAKDLRDLAELTQATATQVLLGCDHGFADRVHNVVAAYDPVHIPWNTLMPDTTGSTCPSNQDETQSRHTGGSATTALDWIDPHDTGAPAPAHRWGTPTTIPTVEYWTFYATARRVLTTEQFEPVHDLYIAIQARLDHWLTQIDHSENLTEDLAYDSLKTLIEEQASIDGVTIALRAAQAAYHQAGWYLAVDERELRNGLVRFPSPATDPSMFDLLRGYYEPGRAGTVALYLSGATPAAIRDTTVGDLAAWESDHTQPVADIKPHERAQPYLRAVLLARALDGSAHTDPAFPGAHRRVRLDLRQASADLGINIGDANLDETTPLGARRVRRRIVKLERLT